MKRIANTNWINFCLAVISTLSAVAGLIFAIYFLINGDTAGVIYSVIAGGIGASFFESKLMK